ncbi:uncharacterized protein GGS25DRAFT_500157 [Hypoxylon fragiforme]|uniref:uncharacterized protein n=1 Tax=Hypoxylon fragiforme TaxID=63214 RepID=UPI0020C72E9C|nr:uncharacterized protein GGS25DRAFT_500157 [Hypoxylon fragiforme]KAI2606218.1 hypothetical protein GGS25DRAFT_500157 [Hypoxylon fragiforme]
MCYGNTALTTFYWEAPISRQPSVRSNSKSLCANWDSIENWTYSRKVSVDPDYKRSSGK